MKKTLCLILSIFCATSAWAIVSEGKAQTVEVKKGLKEDSLIFRVNGKNFSDAKSCGKYCYKRSKWRNEKSPWSNEVYIKFSVDMSFKERQAICDLFVDQGTYPGKILVSFKYEYSPSKTKKTVNK